MVAKILGDSSGSKGAESPRETARNSSEAVALRKWGAESVSTHLANSRDMDDVRVDRGAMGKTKGEMGRTAATGADIHKNVVVTVGKTLARGI